MATENDFADTVNLKKLSNQHFAQYSIASLLLMALAAFLSWLDRPQTPQTGPISFGDLFKFFLTLGLGVWCFAMPILASRKFGFVCPHCGKHLYTANPWVCGFCDYTNTPNRFTASPSLVCGCGNSKEDCSRTPKAYQCDHCDEIIFFDGDRDGRHRATAVGKPRPAILKGQPAPVVEVPATIDPLDERIQAAERRKEAALKQNKVVTIETEAVLAERKAKEREIELDKLQSADFLEKTDPLKVGIYADVEIMRTGHQEEERIKNDPNIPDPIKKRLIDRVKLRVITMLNSTKIR